MRFPQVRSGIVVKRKKKEIQQNGFSGKRGTMLRLSMTLDRRIQNQERVSEVSAKAGHRPT